MARLIVAALMLLVGCSSSNTNADLYGTPAEGGDGAETSSGGSAGADGGVEDAGADADAGPETGTDGAGDGDACVLVQHFNGYNGFVDCHAVGDYDAALALDACASYFGVNCQVFTNPNLCGGANIVGYKSDAWIAWTWTATSGTTRLSWTTWPECPTATDPSWW